MKPPQPSPSPAPTPRRWLFRLAALLLIPLLLLGLTELVLRLAGFGHPTTFFVPFHTGSETILVENDKFGLRFFPPEVARTPSPVVLRPDKTPGTYRIFLFGESAALGDPKPAYGMGRYLETLLEQRYPGRKFEVICVAMTAINSHAILPIARECAQYDGDLWVHYIGNNEMVGAYGANPLSGPKAPPLWTIRASLALQSTRLGQFLKSVTASLRRDKEANGWAGMKMFTDSLVPPHDPVKDRVYAHYEQNLRDILKAGLDAGAKQVVCTVASNLKDSAPFASVHKPGLPDTTKIQWEHHYSLGKQLQSSNHFTEAKVAFLEAAKLDDQFAELHYRLGQCEWSVTNFAAASTHLTNALRFDALPFRAEPPLNDRTRKTAGQFEGVHLVDTEQQLAALNPGNIPGKDQFLDHVHFTTEGNYQIARLIAQSIAPLLPAEVSSKPSTEWASMEQCDQLLALTPWNREIIYEQMWQRVSEPPFITQANHQERVEYLKNQILAARNQMNAEAQAEARKTYEAAISKNPEDFHLVGNYAEFLEANYQMKDAVAQYQRLTVLLPHHWVGFYQAGRVLALLNQNEEAKTMLQNALAIRSDLPDAHVQLGRIAYKENKPEESMQHLSRAMALRPGDPRVRVDIANALAAQDRRTEAVDQLRAAISLNPKYWEARYLLGLELATSNNIPEAVVQFREVTQLRPNHYNAHFNLGIAMAKQGQLREAAKELEETLRLKPDHQRAREYLNQINQLLKATPSP